METNKIYQGDCLEIMREFPDSSIDTIITDPPYGYSFMGKDWDKAVPSVKVWKECLRVLKDGAFLMVMSAPRQDVLSQMIVRVGEAGLDTSFTSIYWTYASGFPKASNIGKMVDKRLGVKRKVLGNVGELSGRNIKNHKKQGEVLGQINGWDKDITEAESKEAKALEGSYGGFQPKPAVEVILVAMKPLTEKTYVDQAMKNRKGITWLDDGRIPYEGKAPRGSGQNDTWREKEGRTDRQERHPTSSSPQGRFPANLLVSDDVLNDGRVSKSSGEYKKQGKWKNTGKGKIRTWDVNYKKLNAYAGDSGSFSRYFDLDKWWAKTFPFLIVPKASKSEKNKGLEGFEERGTSQKYGSIRKNRGSGYEEESVSKNNHPTVKPIKLMSYLITLASRKDDIVLDPFVGSGTTCIAADQLNRKYIGIDLSREYCDIAEARLNRPQKTLF